MDETAVPHVGVTGPDATPDATAPSTAAGPAAPRGGPDVALPGSAAGTNDDGAPTLDPRVSAALQRLEGLGQLDVDEHAAVYDAVHRDLRDALADAATGAVADPA